MKIQIKNSLNYFGPTFLALCVALTCIVGCATSNPLVGWMPASKNPDQVIVNDYQNYIQNLPAEERKYAYADLFFEDGTGQHAVQIKIPLNGTWWRHVLIYDKYDKRIKTIKYASGNYGS